MTLLVLNLDIPSNVPSAEANQTIFRHLIDLLLQFGIYALAFITLGGFWYGHQRQFHFIEHIDAKLLWLNILLMMLMALIPITDNLAGDYSDVQAGILPLEINILAMNLIFGYHWSYAISKPELLRYELRPFDIARSRERHIFQIAISSIAIGTSFFNPSLSVLRTYYCPSCSRVKDTS
jgi:uncharacterized membrane protein